jgi:tetratricopeptide (TPR) repeat protein
MRTPLSSTLLLAILAASAPAQEARKEVAAPLPPRGPMLSDESGKAVQGVRLARADIKAVVHGNLAQATMTLTFANSFAAVLGGNLVFPLPEGATVTGYGLDINGQMVDGVAVEKERARIIYNSELHKRVDPGLVEHVEGNAFRTRLYPIPANGIRSIKIEYVTQVEQSKAGPSLSLPLGFGDGLDELTIRLEAPETAAAPTVTAGGIEGLTFAKAERGFAAMASAKKVKTGDQLVIVLPELADRFVAVEKRLKFPRTIEELEGHNRAADGTPAFEHYFVITDTPSVVPRQAAQLKNKRVGVVWDASLSRGDVDHARELKLLEAALNRMGNPGADLVILRNNIEVRPGFGRDADGTAKMIETIKALPYDGATALGSLTFPKNLKDYGVIVTKTPHNYDLFLLFTDGFGNLGSDRPLRAEVPVYAMSDEAKANYPLLRSICQESGGNYFNLTKSTDEQVLAGVGDAAFSLVSVECKAEEIADVQPPVGTAITGRLTVSGKLLTPQATVTLHYGYGKEVVASQTFTINAASAKEGSLLPRFWAQQKVAALSLFPEKNAEELTRLGRQFNLVTANTSLLVLETVEQYVQYRVVPPPTRPDVYKQFLVEIEQHRAQEAQTQEQKLQQVAVLWNARVQWWEKEYKYPANLKVAPVEAKGSGGGLFAGEGPTTPPLPPAARPADARPEPAAQPGRPIPTPSPAPPAPDAARAGDSRDRDQSVIQNPVRHLQGLSDHPESDVPVRRAHRNDPQEREIDQTVFALLGGQLGKDGKGDDRGAIAITVKPWDPKTPYLEAMKAVAPEKAYDVYLSQRKGYATSPAFYFDCADYLVKSGQRDLGVRVLTDIVELELHDARLLRVAAHRLNQIGERALAIDLFEKVLKLRPEEPQSYRDLALALADRADAAMALAWAAADNAFPPQLTVDAAISDYMRSLELLNKVVLGNWPRFPEVELPVLMEANNIAAKAQRLPRVHDFRNPIDSRLQKNLDLDVRVVMTWDADQTDIDLWVTEPSGEKCFYGHNRTIIGGLLSHDFTDGYGPEEYCLRKLMPGKYVIQANYYGSRQQELTGPATVQATVITNFGRPNEKRQAMTLRLKDMKEIVDVGTVTLGGADGPKAEPVNPASK